MEEYSEEFSLRAIRVRNSDIDTLALKNVDAIVHLAGLAHQMNGAKNEDYFQSNYALTKELAIAAKSQGVKHFIYISTAHVFGSQGDLRKNAPPLTETTPCNPTDTYGQSKLMAEQALNEIASSEFLVSIIRPPLVYGESAKGNIPRLFKLIRKIPILPFGYPYNKRSMVYVSNLTYFIKCVLFSAATGILLPQDDKPLALRDLCTSISAAIGKNIFLFNPGIFGVKVLNIISPQNTKRLFGSLYFDSTASNEKVGYYPKYTIEKGLSRMAKSLMNDEP